MLYLEDYLEMIEHLPIELRDRFTEMREIDLGVENTVDRYICKLSSDTCDICNGGSERMSTTLFFKRPQTVEKNGQKGTVEND